MPHTHTHSIWILYSISQLLMMFKWKTDWVKKNYRPLLREYSVNHDDMNGVQLDRHGGCSSDYMALELSKQRFISHKVTNWSIPFHLNAKYSRRILFHFERNTFSPSPSIFHVGNTSHCWMPFPCVRTEQSVSWKMWPYLFKSSLIALEMEFR